MDDRAWIEHVTGGTLTRFDRMSTGRSRGTWLVDVESPDGSVLELVMRRDTGDGSLSGTEITLERESKVYAALADTAVLIPRLYAISDHGDALLVERARGVEDVSLVTDRHDKLRLAESFIRALAELHNTDTAVLDLPGFSRPVEPSDQALLDLGLWTRIFEGHVRRRAPWVRYGLDWLRRNAPRSDARTVLCHGDVGPGNFMFEGDSVTAILDWEFAHLGDPMDDLAWLSIRGVGLIDFGDFAELLALYTSLTGITIAPDRIRYYQVFVLMRMSVACLVGLTVRSGKMDASTYFNLPPVLAVMGVPIIAERMDVDLGPPPPPLDGAASPDGEVIETLLSDLTTVLVPELDDPAARDRAGGMTTLLAHLAAADRYGPAIAAHEVEELASLLGRAPASPEDGFTELDERISSGKIDDEAELIRYFHRMAARQLQLWPALAAATAQPVPALPGP